MAVRGDCSVLEGEAEEEEETSWVDQQLEKELAGLAHLSLQDLEGEEDCFHGNEECSSPKDESAPFDVRSLFSDYLSTLQGVHGESTVLLTETQQVLAHAEDSIASCPVKECSSALSSEVQQWIVEAEGLHKATDSQSNADAQCSITETQESTEETQSSGTVTQCTDTPVSSTTTALQSHQNAQDVVPDTTDGLCSSLQSKPGYIRDENANCDGELRSEAEMKSEEEHKASHVDDMQPAGHVAGHVDNMQPANQVASHMDNIQHVASHVDSLEAAQAAGESSLEGLAVTSSHLLEDLEEEKNRRQAVLEAMIAEKKRLQSEHSEMLAARAAKEKEARVTILQAVVRGWLVRKAHTPALKAARERRERQRKALECLVTLLQAYARGWLVRQAISRPLQELRERTRLNRGVVHVQARIRGMLVRREVKGQLEAVRARRIQLQKLEWLATPLQAACRGYMLRQACASKLKEMGMKWLRFEGGVVLFQAHCRGYNLRTKQSQTLAQTLAQRTNKRKKEQTICSAIKTIATATSTSSSFSIGSPVKTVAMATSTCSSFSIGSPIAMATSTSSSFSMGSPVEAIAMATNTSSSSSIGHPIAMTTSSSIGSPVRTVAMAASTSSSSVGSPVKTIAMATSAYSTTHSSLTSPSSTGPSLTSFSTSLTTSSGTGGPCLTSSSASTGPDQTSFTSSNATWSCASATGPSLTSPTPSLTSPTAATPTTSTVMNSPGKRKLTMERRLQSSLRAMSTSAFDTSSDRGSSDTSTPTSHPTRGARSDLKTFSMPSLHSQSKGGVQERSPLLEKAERGVGEEGGVTAEAKALQEVVRSREEELAVAQLARERMSAIFSAEEIQLMAERQRKRSSYQLELDSACSPLLPVAWLGLVEERLEWWKKNHAPSTKHACKRQIIEQASPPADIQPSATKTSGCQPISKAHLLAASRRGTKLEEVVQVMLYRTKHPVDLSSLQQCPNLRTLTLSHCELEVLTGLSAQHCPHLIELVAQSNNMKQVCLGCQDNLCFLDLSDNHLASIHGLSHAPSLLHLTLMGNRVARVNGVTGCPKLQRLILDSNLLINTKGLEDLRELEYFSCCENHLPVVEGLLNSRCLQYLLLSQNNLQQVPSLVNHVLLRELTLEENSVSDVTPITEAWLPLLQSLQLANNCISQLSSLLCLIMLRHLDLTMNSLYDLPMLLQALRGCYSLKTLLLSGNPVTQEKKFSTHMLKTLPSLEELVVTDSGVGVASGMEEGQSSGGRRRRPLPELITSSNIYTTCLNHIEEQDELKERQKQEIESLTGCSEDYPGSGGSGTLSPDTTAKALQLRASHCHAYHRLLRQHLLDQEVLEPGKWREKRAREQAVLNAAAVTLQAAWRGKCGRGLAASRREERDKQQLNLLSHAATRIQAWFRGCSLRQRLYAVVGRGLPGGGNPIPPDEDEFDYEEEIVLDFLDEGMLEEGLVANFDTSPTGPPKGGGGVATMMFGVPGATTDSEVSYQEWQDACHAHRPPLETRATPPPPPDHAHPEEDSQQSPAARGVVMAWGDGGCGQTGSQQEGEGQPQGGGVKGEGPHTTKYVIKNEWGFSSEKTARLMWRRAQRQKHFHTASARRKKLEDPTIRLAHFKKHHAHNLSASHTPPSVTTPPLISTGQSSVTVKIHSVASLEELSAKEHSQYQWEHSHRVGRRKPSEPDISDHTHSSLLPDLDPHVLAGNMPRLVSSDVDKHTGTVGRSAGHTHFAEAPKKT